MRKNRPIGEYIEMLRVDIDTLDAVIRHIEIAHALYKTRFVSIGYPWHAREMRSAAQDLLFNARRARDNIETIESRIRSIKELHDYRDERRRFWEMMRAPLGTGENADLPF